jgi:hypothetical protein
MIQEPSSISLDPLRINNAKDLSLYEVHRGIILTQEITHTLKCRVDQVTRRRKSDQAQYGLHEWDNFLEMIANGFNPESYTMLTDYSIEQGIRYEVSGFFRQIYLKRTKNQWRNSLSTATKNQLG